VAKLSTPNQADDPQEEARQELTENGILCKWRLDQHQLPLYVKLLDFYLNSKQQDFVLLCARRFGKSVLTTTFAFEVCLNTPRAIVRLIAPTKLQAAEIAADIIQPLLMPYCHRRCKRVKSSYRWEFSNGSSFRLGSLEEPQSMRGGGNATIILIEEAAVACASDVFKEAYKSVIMPQVMRSYGKIIHVTTASADPDHYFHTTIQPKAELNNCFVLRTIRDNTSLTPERIEDMIANQGGEEDETCQREYFCKIVRSAVRAIVPEEPIVADFGLPQAYNAHTCIDMGGVRDHTHGLLYYYDFMSQVIHIYDEFHHRPNTPTSEIRKSAAAMESRVFDIHSRYVDAGQAQQIIDMNANGFACTKVDNKDPVAAIQNVRRLIATRQLVIHERCKHLLACLRSGQWNEKRTEFMRTEAFGHADAIAALMYACRNFSTANPYIRKPRTDDVFKIRQALSRPLEIVRPIFEQPDNPFKNRM
jgi:hypothetical protein